VFTAAVSTHPDGSLEVRIDAPSSISLRYVVELARVAADLRAMALASEPAQLHDDATR
jgi:hypothetical protein